MAVKPVQNPSVMSTLQDEVAPEASPILQFLIDHARLIALAVVVFIVAIFGYWLYARNEAARIAEEQIHFGKVIQGKAGAERVTALDAFIQTAPESLKPAAWFALAEAALEAENHEKVYEAWKNIAGIDPAIRVTATVAMADALVKMGKTPDALTLLDDANKGLTPDDALIVNGRIAALAENIHDYPRAIAACEAITANPTVDTDHAFWAQKTVYLRQKAAAVK